MDINMISSFTLVPIPIHASRLNAMALNISCNEEMEVTSAINNHWGSYRKRLGRLV